MTEIIDAMPNLNGMDQQQFTQALVGQARSEGVELMLCALAANIWILVALRLVQGIGGAFALVIATRWSATARPAPRRPGSSHG